MSESDVYRRQILTYKNGPCTERVNVICILMLSLDVPNRPTRHHALLTLSEGPSLDVRYDV